MWIRISAMLPQSLKVSIAMALNINNDWLESLSLLTLLKPHQHHLSQIILAL